MASRSQAIRTCVGCGGQKPKRELTRIVRTVNGEVALDLTGKTEGRGVYLCREGRCLEKALQRKSIDRALQVNLSAESRRELGQRILLQVTSSSSCNDGT